MNKSVNKNRSIQAFTIVELLIVIVIIGILAAITIVSYTNITGKANQASLISDLTNAKKQFELYKVDHGEYPTGLNGDNCPTGNTAPNPDTRYCLKSSSGAYFTLNGGGTNNYDLKLTKGDIAYIVTNNTTPTSTTATTVTFAKAWGSTNYDEGSSVVQTSDGGYAISGMTNSYGAGSYDALLIKYDSSGNVSWSKTWGGAGDDRSYGLIQTIDGGYAITGYTSSFGAGSGDAFLAKYDPSGNLSWSKTWGGTSNDSAGTGGLIQSSDGGYVVSGQTNSYGAGNSDIYLAKYDSVGNLVWSKTWGGSNYEYGLDLIQTNDGGYATTGYTNSYGAGSYDALLIKYDSSGNVSWSKTWGGAGDDRSYVLAQTNDSGYAIAAWTGGYGAGSNDALLIKYDSSGNLSWNKTWGGANVDYAYDIAQTIDGGYVIAGFTTSYGAGYSDVFWAKFDPSGNLSWNKTWGGANYDYGFSISRFSNYDFIIVGRSDGYGVGGGDVLILKTNSSGTITNCNTTICQSPTATVTSPGATTTSPSATTTSPSVTTTSPTATVTSPSATNTTIVAP